MSILRTNIKQTHQELVNIKAIHAFKLKDLYFKNDSLLHIG